MPTGVKKPSKKRHYLADDVVADPEASSSSSAAPDDAKKPPPAAEHSSPVDSDANKLEPQHSSPTASADAKPEEHPSPVHSEPKDSSTAGSAADPKPPADQRPSPVENDSADDAKSKPEEEQQLSPFDSAVSDANKPAEGQKRSPTTGASDAESEHSPPADSEDANKERLEKNSVSPAADLDAELKEQLHSTPPDTAGQRTLSQFLAKLQALKKPGDDSDSALLALLVTSKVLPETTEDIEAMYDVQTQVVAAVAEVEQVISGTLYGNSFFDPTTNCVIYSRFVVWRSVGNANSIHVEVLSVVGVKEALENKTIYMKGTAAAPGAQPSKTKAADSVDSVNFFSNSSSSCNNSSTSDGCSGSPSLGVLSSSSPAAKKRAWVGGGGESGTTTTKSITLSALLTGRILCTGVLDSEHQSEPVVIIAANVVDYYIGAGATRPSAPPPARGGPNEVPLLFKDVVDEITCLPQDVMDAENLLLISAERLFENPNEFPSLSVSVAGSSRTYVTFHMIRSTQKT